MGRFCEPRMEGRKEGRKEGMGENGMRNRGNNTILSKPLG